MLAVESPTIALSGKYCTDVNGISRLLHIYDQAHQYENTDVTLDCQNLQHLDANLVSLLAALDYRLVKEKNVQFKTDFSHLKRKFAFLFHNGFLKDADFNETDPLQQPLQLTQIDVNDEIRFFEFLKGQLMCHKAIAPIDDNLKRQIQSEIIEVHTNIRTHSRSNSPFFACGHHYPAAKILKITLVDLGIGFLTPIRDYLHKIKDQRKIFRDGDAIQWAL